MEDKQKYRRMGRSAENAPEMKVVGIAFTPGPDAEDRLRRLFTILLEHAVRDRQAVPEEDAPTEVDAEEGE